MSDQETSGLTFPCDFPIKAIGKARDDLDAIVYALVSPHVPDLGEGAIRTRPSKGGNYLSITVTVQATSREQLDAIYMSLSASEHLTMVL
ncbi:MAG: DUF493 family protein [Gammaproteobacteria bacterium]|nr:DUF493 family protein [Gammaproteobacteria bacterium]